MRTRITSGIVAGVLGLAALVPAVGLADRGGHPHNTTPCKVHRHYGHHRGASQGKKRGLNRGRKCGFGPTGPTTSTVPTGSTLASGSTVSTESTGSSHGKGHHYGHSS